MEILFKLILLFLVTGGIFKLGNKYISASIASAYKGTPDPITYGLGVLLFIFGAAFCLFMLFHLF